MKIAQCLAGLLLACCFAGIAGRAQASGNQSVCPWMPRDAVAILLGSEGLIIESGEADTCMADSPVGSVAVVTEDVDIARELAPAMQNDCPQDVLPELGELAKLTYGCKDIVGPFAAVNAIVGDKHVEFNFKAGERDPTAEERAKLIEVARAAQAAGR